MRVLHCMALIYFNFFISRNYQEIKLIFKALFASLKIFNDAPELPLDSSKLKIVDFTIVNDAGLRIISQQMEFIFGH